MDFVLQAPSWQFGIRHGKIVDDGSPGPVYNPDVTVSHVVLISFLKVKVTCKSLATLLLMYETMIADTEQPRAFESFGSLSPKSFHIVHVLNNVTFSCFNVGWITEFRKMTPLTYLQRSLVIRL